MLKYFAKANLTTLLLGGIFVIALLLRTWNLAMVPFGIHGDEASIGYNAYSLLKTARDQNNNFLPLAIDQFGDFRPVGYHYTAIPFVAILGLNEFSTRLPAALFGALSVIVMFYLADTLFRNKKIGLLAAGVLALNPWHISTSRSTSEGVIAMFFILLGTYCYLKALHTFSKKILIVAHLCLFTSLLFYHAARFFAPMFLLFLIIIAFTMYSQSRSQKKYILGITVMFFLVASIHFLISQGTSRPLNVSIFTSPQTLLVQQEKIHGDVTTHRYVTQFFHNKITEYGLTFTTNYLSYFSHDFLFISGGFPARYRIPYTGTFYIFDAVFMLTGFAVMFYKGFLQKETTLTIPLFWAFVAPIPAALTFEDIPNIQRSSMLIPAMTLIIAYGIYYFYKLPVVQKFKYPILVSSCSIILYSIALFLHNYFLHGITYKPWYRNAGQKELVTTIGSVMHKYPKIITTSNYDNNIIFYLFYLHSDPAYYHSIGSPRDKDAVTFKNITFIHEFCPLVGDTHLPTKGEKPNLYVNTGECKQVGAAKKIKEIRLPDQTQLFTLYEY